MSRHHGSRVAKPPVLFADKLNWNPSYRNFRGIQTLRALPEHTLRLTEKW